MISNNERNEIVEGDPPRPAQTPPPPIRRIRVDTSPTVAAPRVDAAASGVTTMTPAPIMTGPAPGMPPPAITGTSGTPSGRSPGRQQHFT